MTNLSFRARARPKQIQPEGSWLIWYIQSGRGWGKNFTGANNIIEAAKKQELNHCALVGPTAADVRDMMIDPDKKNSGIMANAPADFYPHYEPSKRQLTFPNGQICTAYSAEDPDQLRGPTHGYAWCDEIAAWKHHSRQQAWDNLRFTLRAGLSRTIITTTPKPILLLKQIRQMDDVFITTGNTQENVVNLSAAYIATVIQPYIGTRLGRQEIEGELLEENELALFDMKTLDTNRLTIPYEDFDFAKIAVSVDPVGSVTGHGCGIAVGGLMDDYGYLIADYSLDKATPNQWAEQVLKAYDDFDADYVIVERNYGGDMVANTVRLVAQALGFKPPLIKEVNATRGKTIRAEPVSMLSQQNRIKILGSFREMEDQLYNLESGMANDRADAFVWLFTELLEKMLRRRIRPRAGSYKEALSRVSAATTAAGSLWDKEF